MNFVNCKIIWAIRRWRGRSCLLHKSVGVNKQARGQQRNTVTISEVLESVLSTITVTNVLELDSFMGTYSFIIRIESDFTIPTFLLKLLLLEYFKAIFCFSRVADDDDFTRIPKYISWEWCTTTPAILGTKLDHLAVRRWARHGRLRSIFSHVTGVWGDFTIHMFTQATVST